MRQLGRYRPERSIGPKLARSDLGMSRWGHIRKAVPVAEETVTAVVVAEPAVVIVVVVVDSVVVLVAELPVGRRLVIAAV